MPVPPDARVSLRMVLLTVSVLAFGLLASHPRWLADTMGVLAALTLALVALMVMLGVTVSYAQDRQPPELFQVRRLRLKATPIIGLLLLALLVTELIGKPTDIHAIRGTGTIPDRPTLSAAFAHWLRQDSCTVPLTGFPGLNLRPMLMYGAEGGGIRATYWTASVLGEIGAAGDGCARSAALFSAGASGGALGLTVGRFDPAPLDAVKEMAGPNALGGATISLASGDLVASGTGIRFLADAQFREPSRVGLDRAGLMETAWEENTSLVHLQRQAFLPVDESGIVDGAESTTGHLILTSTVAVDGCRALLSQIDLSKGATTSDGWPVCGHGEAGADSYDLFEVYGRQASDPGDDCVGNLPAMTVGLVASRFPYITPSAVVPACRGLQTLQLIDGGYTDNTGLGTVIALAPQWEAQVKKHNDAVLTEGIGDLVLPMVVYIENGTGDDYDVSAHAESEQPDNADSGAAQAPAPSSNTSGNIGWSGDLWPRKLHIPEPLVVPVGLIAATDHKVSAPLALSEAQRAIRRSLCTPAVAGCNELVKAGQVAHPVIVVHQSVQPSIAAPLGWVLSDASQADLLADLSEQKQKGRVDLVSDPASQKGYGSLRDLLTALGS